MELKPSSATSISKEGFQKVVAYTDSIEAYQLLMNGTGHNHPLKSEIAATREIIYSEWDFELRHASRETIKCTDFLDKNA